MTGSIPRLDHRKVYDLSESPTANAISDLRDQAKHGSESVAASIPSASDTYLVISPRGTCVLLDDYLKRNSWTSETSAETIAQELPEA